MGGWNSNRCKVNLKLAVTRLKMLQQKKASLNNNARREVAQLLEKGKEESGRIRVEHIIREDLNTEAMEILELYCELLLARFGLLDQMKHCDPGIAEAVNSIIYAAPRSEVDEMNIVRELLIAKFGKDFAMAAMENKNDCVNSRLVHKLRVQAPDPFLVTQYLKEIARSFGIKWEESVPMDNPSNALLPSTGNLLGDVPTGLGPAPLQPAQLGTAAGLTSASYGGASGFVPVAAGGMPGQAAQGPPMGAFLDPVAPPASLGSLGPAPTTGGFPMGGYASTQAAPTPRQAPGAVQLPGMQGGSVQPQNVQPTPPLASIPSLPTFPELPPNTLPSLGGPPSLPTFPQPPAAGAPAEDSTGVDMGGLDDDVPDFDELTRRFEALKRR